MKNEITYTDLFAGIGGFRYGLEKVGKHIQKERSSRENIRPNKSMPFISPIHKGRGSKYTFNCIYSNEWDKYCAKIYQKNFGEAPDTRDIRTVPSGEIPDHDLLCAGFPCPTFSIAGKGKGFEDTRGAVFFEIPRILRDKRPRYFLLENVKGLLSHQAGETFQTILGVLSDLGYRCEWQVLNSKDFGVPQNRERVFIVGHLGEGGGSQVFPIEENGETYIEANKKSRGRQVSNTLSKKSASGMNARGTYVIHDKRQAKELRIQDKPCVTRHYRTGGGNVPLVANAVDCDAYLRTGRRKRVDGKVVLTSITERRIRKLTPIECERLQGFPDNFTKGVSDTQRYRMLGNAVTVNVIEAIGRRLREVLDAEG